MLRNPREAVFQKVASYILTERPWKNDTRVAAKVMYLILVLLQYQTVVSNHADLFAAVETVVSHLVNHPPQDETLKITSDIAQRLGAVIRLKMSFHAKYPCVRGNFSIQPSTVTSSLIPALKTHLTMVYGETAGLKLAVGSTEFMATVLWQPMVDETVSAYRLFKSIIRRGQASRLIYDVEMLIWGLPEIPYIATTVPFPVAGEAVSIPRERYPGLKALV
jgi:hypothetical protein